MVETAARWMSVTCTFLFCCFGCCCCFSIAAVASLFARFLFLPCECSIAFIAAVLGSLPTAVMLFEFLSLCTVKFLFNTFGYHWHHGCYRWTVNIVYDINAPLPIQIIDYSCFCCCVLPHAIALHYRNSFRVN